MSSKVTPGNALLKAILAEVVWVVSHMKANYLSAQYHRLARRLGKNKAAMAIAHDTLVIIYHVLRAKKPCSNLSADYFDKLGMICIMRRSVQQLESLGYQVTLTPREIV